MASEASTSIPGCALAQRGDERRADLVAGGGRAPEPQRAEHAVPGPRGVGERLLDGLQRGRPSASSRRPASVSSTLRVVRTNSSTPSSASSCRIAWLTGEAAMCSRSAAREKLSSSATATK